MENQAEKQIKILNTGNQVVTTYELIKETGKYRPVDAKGNVYGKSFSEDFLLNLCQGTSYFLVEDKPEKVDASKLKDLNATLAEKDNEIAALKSSVADKDKELQEKSKAVEDLSKEVDGKNNLLAEKDKEIATLKSGTGKDEQPVRPKRGRPAKS